MSIYIYVFCYHWLLLLGRVVTVISGQLCVPRVGHGVAILATRAGDLMRNNIIIVASIQIETLG